MFFNYDLKNKVAPFLLILFHPSTRTFTQENCLIVEEPAAVNAEVVLNGYSF